MKTNSSTTPPKNAQRILSWADLPPAADSATYELISTTGETRTVTLKGGNRRVLEGLMRGPLYCASPVRVSDRVMVLKRDHGVTIRTEVFESDGTTECERFGIYFLDDEVRGVGFEEAA
ncbi:hypothetical protein [Tropicimonas sp. IMCC6043]|uniref:hypothetical protein n=1 Tax=Tropicimonas sp. IMCC6043 TaxID=2510645 RepID=UPI00101DD22E|nr:hypothetical protein [Tropicimonas sp. IMCC6043]RYH08828.1 hypothetical protein EU800_15215 [Tropicimonas sp. IMCC6043]